LKKTIIKETTVDQLPAYQMFNDRLEKLMNSEEFKKLVYHKHVPEMSKPLYNVLMFNKVNYLQEVADINPFNTEYFSWVDAGFIRNSSELGDLKKWPDPSKLVLLEDKIKFFCINSEIERHVRDVQGHVLSQMRLLKGTVFFIHKNLIPFIKEKFNYHVDDSLNNGYIGSDEKIFDLCCLRNPELFDLYKCDWREEIKLFSYGYKKQEKIEYTVEVEWSEYDVEKCEDFQFWFFCIEDEKHQSIFREDLEIDSIEKFEEFKNYKRVYKITSDRKPSNFVVWPVSKSRGYLKYVNKPVRIL
jgi:hypothetical protein